MNHHSTNSSPKGVAGPAAAKAIWFWSIAALITQTIARLQTDYKWAALLPIWITAAVVSLLWGVRTDARSVIQRWGVPILTITYLTALFARVSNYRLPTRWEYGLLAMLIVVTLIIVTSYPEGFQVRAFLVAVGIAAAGVGTSMIATQIARYIRDGSHGLLWTILGTTILVAAFGLITNDISAVWGPLIVLGTLLMFVGAILAVYGPTRIGIVVVVASATLCCVALILRRGDFLLPANAEVFLGALQVWTAYLPYHNMQSPPTFLVIVSLIWGVCLVADGVMNQTANVVVPGWTKIGMVISCIAVTVMMFVDGAWILAIATAAFGCSCLLLSFSAVRLAPRTAALR